MAPKRKTRKARPAADDQAPSPAEDEAIGNAEEVVVEDGGGGDEEAAAPKPSSKKARADAAAAAAASRSEKKAKAEKRFVKKAAPPPKKGKKVAVEDKKGIDEDEPENEENEEEDDDEEDEEVVDEHKFVHQKQSVQQTSLIIIEARYVGFPFRYRTSSDFVSLKVEFVRFLAWFSAGSSSLLRLCFLTIFSNGELGLIDSFKLVPILLPLCSVSFLLSVCVWFR
jgi:hypothetical protein